MSEDFHLKHVGTVAGIIGFIILALGFMGIYIGLQ